MTPKQGRRADDISAEEIKQFWHDFCERKGVDAATRARGDAKHRQGSRVLGRPDDAQIARRRRHLTTPRSDYLEFGEAMT